MRSEYLKLLMVALIIGTGGCAGYAGQPKARDDTLERSVDFPKEPAQAGTKPAVTALEEIIEPTGVITLKDAAAFALLHNPELQAFSHELRAADARNLQAGLLPNPELEIEIEEFGGTGERGGFDSSEATIQLGQLIELAGKRSKRIHLAALGKELARYDYESRRLDVMHDVTLAFVDVLAAREQLALAEELHRLAAETRSAVAQRVEAGKDSPVAKTRADVAVSKSRIHLRRARQALISARYRLAQTWGSSTPTFDTVGGDYYAVSAAPSVERLSSAISKNPDMARWAAEESRRRAAVQLERAKATSDVRISGGMRYLDEADDTAFVAGLSIGLPLFDRNQGGIRESIEMLNKTRAQRRASEVAIRAGLANALQGLAAALDEIRILRDEVLPGAQHAFDAAQQGYREGKFDYLYVLDAQRTLFDARARYIEALARHHRARATAERLLGRSIDSLVSPKEFDAKGN